MYNEGISSSWGHCSIYKDVLNQEKRVEFRFPDEQLQQESLLLQVGLNDCHDDQEISRWYEFGEGDT